jgi:hypothetical protein
LRCTLLPSYCQVLKGEPLYQLLEALKQQGFLTLEEFTSIRKTCRSLKENQVKVLRSLNILTQHQIQAVFFELFALEILAENFLKFLSPNLSLEVPRTLALQLGVLPLGKNPKTLKPQIFNAKTNFIPTNIHNTKNDFLKIAVEDPLDPTMLHKLKFFLEVPFLLVCGTAEQILKGLSLVYGVNSDEVNLQSTIEKSRGILPHETNIGARIELNSAEEIINEEILKKSLQIESNLPQTTLTKINSELNLKLKKETPNFLDEETTKRNYIRNLAQGVSVLVAKNMLLQKTDDILKETNFHMLQFGISFEEQNDFLFIRQDWKQHSIHFKNDWKLPIFEDDFEFKKLSELNSCFKILTPAVKQILKKLNKGGIIEKRE